MLFIVSPSNRIDQNVWFVKFVGIGNIPSKAQLRVREFIVCFITIIPCAFLNHNNIDIPWKKILRRFAYFTRSPLSTINTHTYMCLLLTFWSRKCALFQNSHIINETFKIITSRRRHRLRYKPKTQFPEKQSY